MVQVLSVGIVKMAYVPLGSVSPLIRISPEVFRKVALLAPVRQISLYGTSSPQIFRFFTPGLLYYTLIETPFTCTESLAGGEGLCSALLLQEVVSKPRLKASTANPICDLILDIFMFLNGHLLNRLLV